MATHLSPAAMERKRERSRIWMRSRKRPPSNPAKDRERYQRERNDRPERLRARWVLIKAIKRGAVVRPESCSRCRVRCTPHGHHADYDKPLDVVWVCPLCHKAIHRMPMFLGEGI